MAESLRVLLLSPEVFPFAKTGGLADVAGSLPKSIKGLGCDIRVAMPYYRMTKKGDFQVKVIFEDVEIPLFGEVLNDSIFSAEADGGVPLYLINKDEFFDREFLYGTSKGDYFDNMERFVYFSRMAFILCKMLDFQPHVFHCNDWQTALIPAYLRTLYRKDPFFSGTFSVFTIHNIAYQGIFDEKKLGVTGLPMEVYHPGGMEYWGKINLLKAGIVFSDVVNTVSHAYSREIQTPEFGYGMEGVLRDRSNDLYGILNGADYGEWNPKTDPLIAANYDEKDLSGKAKCKEDLLAEFNLPGSLKKLPLLAIISRLADQKGLDLLAEIMEDLMKMDLGFVLLGTGDEKYHKLFKSIAKEYPKKAGIKIAYDNTLAHKIEAGSDIFLMPSRYEPCGLNQMYSLKYGTVPLVRAAGGLDDTIQDYDPKTGEGTGFKFQSYDARDFLDTVRRALAVYRDGETWKRLIIRGMKADFSWQRAAKEYMDLYRRARAKRKLIPVGKPRAGTFSG
ncbi:MAG: glycogen synthase GlgA [Syntrophobacterales bacterium]|nr:MAG: glycogen synthase GlgA [Syntrophobacterales bacterium]